MKTTRQGDVPAPKDGTLYADFYYEEVGDDGLERYAVPSWEYRFENLNALEKFMRRHKDDAIGGTFYVSFDYELEEGGLGQSWIFPCKSIDEVKSKYPFLT